MLSFRNSVLLGAAFWAMASGYSSASARPPEKPVPSAPPHSARETPPNALQKSYAEERAGNCKAAARIIEEEVGRHPSSYFLRARLGYLETCAKNYARAAKAYAEAAQLDRTGVEALLGEQHALIMLARYKEAEPVGIEIVRRDPNSYLGNSRLAWSLYNLGQYSRSVPFYQKVVTLYPADIEMQLGLAWALFKAGRRVDAARRFRQVLEMSPENASARQGLQLL